MLIDDDNEDNYFHQLVIDEMNITENVEMALSGFDALDYLKNDNQTPPELIFLDINMPKMNGWEFLEEHNKLPETQKAKVIVIMLSSKANQEDVERTTQFPEKINFTTKPITEESVLKILEQYYP